MCSESAVRTSKRILYLTSLWCAADKDTQWYLHVNLPAPLTWLCLDGALAVVDVVMVLL